MSSAAWPTVRGALFTVAGNALPGPNVRVVEGRDISNDPGDLVMIGVADPEVGNGLEQPGSFQQEMLAFGGSRAETGTVNGVVIAWNGNADQGDAFTAAHGYFALIEAAVRADPTLGLSSFQYMVAEIQSGDVQEAQTGPGALTALTFVLTYRAGI